MSDDSSPEQSPATRTHGHRRLREDVLQLGPRKKAYAIHYTLLFFLTYSVQSRRCIANPLIHFGRHFGRTIHAFCNINALITNGLLRLGELADEPEEAFTIE